MADPFRINSFAQVAIAAKKSYHFQTIPKCNIQLINISYSGFTSALNIDIAEIWLAKTFPVNELTHRCNFAVDNIVIIGNSLVQSWQSNCQMTWWGWIFSKLRVHQRYTNILTCLYAVVHMSSHLRSIWLQMIIIICIWTRVIFHASNTYKGRKLNWIYGNKKCYTTIL